MSTLESSASARALTGRGRAVRRPRTPQHHEAGNVNIPPRLRAHWRTLAGAAVGAVLGAAYAHFIGCRTGTCPLTGNVWTAAGFFGFTGAIVGLPGPRKPGGQPEQPAS